MDHDYAAGGYLTELAVRFNYNDPSGAEKAYKKAIKKIQDNLDAGEYGRWVEIPRMRRLAQRNGPVGEAKDRTDITVVAE